MKNIISYSGGKDSTALILYCIERKYRIDEVIFCDTGVEYPEIYENVAHMKMLCAELNIDFTILKGDFLKLLMQYRRFPIFNVRGCTAQLKRDKVNKYLRQKYGLHNYYNLCGIAYDERERCKQSRYFRYPLVEGMITEEMCLNTLSIILMLIFIKNSLGQVADVVLSKERNSKHNKILPGTLKNFKRLGIYMFE